MIHFLKSQLYFDSCEFSTDRYKTDNTSRGHSFIRKQNFRKNVCVSGGKKC